MGIVQHDHQWYLFNWYAWKTLLAVGVLSSVLATIGTQAQWDKRWLGFLAAVPAAAIGIQSQFGFYDAAVWHYKKEMACRALLREMQCANASERQQGFCHRLTEIENQLDANWGPIAKTSGKPTMVTAAMTPASLPSE